ncbi:peroxiredoxin family protein [Actinophytocola sp.]|uniref:peroxiredoxin family protein n=1 Tax=Actinophytocola sp. TaxID=1872138 RepID=UPI002D449F68|nr:redoxin domain-containing protein [Actinophytocola sp.]HYQ61846.1 redoxin domain-containing protein [Actinophytocola sp.]
MTVLVVAVMVLCFLCLFDLLLTLGVLRRLRDHEVRLERSAGQPNPLDNLASSLVQGSRPGPFTATTTDGGVLALDDLLDGTVVAFMSPHCRPCVANLPNFVEHVSGLPDGRRRVVAVLTGEEVEARSMADRLEPVAQVVIEPFDGPMTKAFDVTALPVIFVVKSDGTVAATSYEIDQLLGPMAAVVR